jgi:hypothetical protein
MCSFAVNNIRFYFADCGRGDHAAAFAQRVTHRTIGDGA